jgi:hypothetical protein
VSQAKAAEIAGLSRAEFLAALDHFGVTPFQVTADELIWDETFVQTEDKLVAAAKRARREIDLGNTEPLDLNRL